MEWSGDVFDIGIIAEVMENKFEVYSKVIGDSMIEWFSTFSV